MGDRIAVMAHGRILQEGAPWTLYGSRPNCLLRSSGEMNFLFGTEPGDGQRAMVTTQVGPLMARSPSTRQVSVVLDFARGRGAAWRGAPGGNVICARVTARHYLGDAFL
jgi:ABC-type Fe3+/spermidine/putrescine transport system ATPase subunit